MKKAYILKVKYTTKNRNEIVTSILSSQVEAKFKDFQVMNADSITSKKLSSINRVKVCIPS